MYILVLPPIYKEEAVLFIQAWEEGFSIEQLKIFSGLFTCQLKLFPLISMMDDIAIPAQAVVVLQLIRQVCLS